MNAFQAVATNDLYNQGYDNTGSPEGFILLTKFTIAYPTWPFVSTNQQAEMYKKFLLDNGYFSRKTFSIGPGNGAGLNYFSELPTKEVLLFAVVAIGVIFLVKKLR
jgi:hypothetical protein